MLDWTKPYFGTRCSSDIGWWQWKSCHSPLWSHPTQYYHVVLLLAGWTSAETNSPLFYCKAMWDELEYTSYAVDQQGGAVTPWVTLPSGCVHQASMVFSIELLQLWLTLHGYLKECASIKGFIGNCSHLTLDYGQLITFFCFSTQQIYLKRVCDYRILVNRRKKVGKRRGFAAEASFWPTRSWSTFWFFFFPKEAEGNVANVDVAVQPALLVLSTKTKRHQILRSPVM